MSNSRPTISPANLSKIEERFKRGVQRIAEIQNNKAVNCFKQNPNSISGFVDCFRVFHEKNIELGSLIEQRMNWSLIQYADCIKGSPSVFRSNSLVGQTEAACLKQIMDNVETAFSRTSQDLEWS